MKKYIGISAAAFLVACAPQDDSSLGKLNSTRDSLKLEISRINEEIAVVEAAIKDIDTNNVKKIYVTAASVGRKDFSHYINVHGNVEVSENAVVYAEAMGKIQKIHVKEGQKVIAGAVLATLKADVMNNSINELEKQLALAKDVFEKQESLWKQEVGSEMQYLQAKTNYESLQARVKATKSQKDQFVIRAPFSGVIDEVFAKKGEMAAPQAPFARIVNLRGAYLKADISESYVQSIVPGTLAKVKFAGNDQELNAKVSTTGDFINPNNRTFKVRVNLPEKGNFKPNMLANIYLRDAHTKDGIVLPSSLIQQDRKGVEYVYVLDDRNVVKRVNLKTGLSYGGETLVTEGLADGMRYVNKGSRSVQEGDLVIVK